MSEPGDELRGLLAGEIARHVGRLEQNPIDPQQVRTVLHALKGSAAVAQEHDLSLVIAQVGASVRAGDLRLVAGAGALLREAQARLERGQSALATSWPQPPPLLAQAPVKPRFRAEYRAAMQDRLAELEAALANPDGATALGTVYRTVHAMKGAAGSVGDDLTAWYCHGLETQLKPARESGTAEPLVDLEAHRRVIALLIEHPDDALVRLRSLRGPAASAHRRSLASELPPPDPSSRPESDALLRVPASAADRLLEHLEGLHLVQDELRMAAAAARDLAAGLRRDAAGRDADADAARAERVAHACRRGAEELHAKADAMRAAVATLRRTTMDSLFDRVGYAVERLTAAGDRPVRLRTSGGDLPIDRRVADRLVEPVLQLARNALAHGIESAAGRAQAGKAEAGTIFLRAERLGDWLRLVVEDDGRGVDAERVRTLAVERGALSAEAARTAAADDLLPLLFLPGLTTRVMPDLVAGRGVGLPLVHDLVRRMGGTLRLAERTPCGLSVTIEVPGQEGMIEVLWVTCAGHVFALPTGFLGSAVPIDEAPEAIALGDCLGLPDADQPSVSLELALHGIDPIRIGVDAVGEPEETRIRALPAALAAAGPYSGAILRGDGSLRLALDVAVLAARAWAARA